MKKLTSVFLGLALSASLPAWVQADNDIPVGTQTATFTVPSAGSYDIPVGTTLSYSSPSAGGSAIHSTQSGTILDINGSIVVTTSEEPNDPQAILVQGGTYNINVGLFGSIQTLNSDVIFVKSSGIVSIDNQGHIFNTEDDGDGTSTTGLPDATDADAINVAKSASPISGDTSSTNGGIITNGSLTNTAAEINSNVGYGIDLGSNMTVNNYGTILANPIFNEIPFNGAHEYLTGRGIEFEKGSYDTINNSGIITGSQAGVDATTTSSVGLVVNNSGTITGENGSGIGSDTLGTAASTFVVTNTATGKILAQNAGPGNIVDSGGDPNIDSDPDGIDIDGGSTIFNYGLVQTQEKASGADARGRANTADGLSLGGGNVFNYAGGQIISAQNGVTVNNDSNPGRSGGTALNLENDGLIQGQSGYAIRSENNGSASVDTDTVVNTGTIIGGTVAPDPSVDMLLSDGSEDTFAYGTVNGIVYTAGTNMQDPDTGAQVPATAATYMTPDGVVHTGNAQLIQGDGSAIQMGNGNDVLTNTGAIYGTTDGTMTGPAGKAINMEDGDDTVNLEQGSKIVGDIDGGNGSEVVGDTLNLDLDDTLGLHQLSADGTADGTAITATPGASDTFIFASAILDFEHVNAISGKTILTGNSTYVGETIIGGGTAKARFEQDGTHTGGLDYHVMENGTLAGSGTVTLATAATTITVDQGGTFAPGSTASTGKFTVAQGSALINGTLAFRLDGTTAGVSDGYDQLDLALGNTGTFTLGDTSTLSLTLGFTPTVGSQFTLVDIENAGTSVAGTFAGLAEGSDFVSGNQEFQISYKGGDGNDIVITDVAAAPEPSTWAMLVGSAGLLVFLFRRKTARANDLN